MLPVRTIAALFLGRTSLETGEKEAAQFSGKIRIFLKGAGRLDHLSLWQRIAIREI
jgi:hypothetical protein